MRSADGKSNQIHKHRIQLNKKSTKFPSIYGLKRLPLADYNYLYY